MEKGESKQKVRTDAEEQKKEIVKELETMDERRIRILFQYVKALMT